MGAEEGSCSGRCDGRAEPAGRELTHRGKGRRRHGCSGKGREACGRTRAEEDERRSLPLPSSLPGRGMEAPGCDSRPHVLAEAVAVGARRAQAWREGERAPGAEPEAGPTRKPPPGQGGCGQSGGSLRPRDPKMCRSFRMPTLRRSLEAQGWALTRDR